MFRYTLRRVPSALVVVVAASWVVFAVLRLVPGDPAVVLAGIDSSAETVDAIRSKLGLDEPILAQYFTWLRDLVHGDFGRSYIVGAPIGELIGRGVGKTLELTAAALLLAVVMGGIAGLVLGTTKRKAAQTVVGGLVSLAFAVPTYVSGVLLVLLFAVTVRVLPPGGHVSVFEDPMTGVQFLVMPALCLALPAAAVIARFLAASVRKVLDEDFVQTGVAKGLSRRRLVFRHVLPNALPPVVTILGIQVGQLLSGAIVVEAIFAWPGVGRLLLQGVLSRDYLLVQDLLLLAVVVFVLLQTLTDLAHAALDPRLRLEGR